MADETEGPVDSVPADGSEGTVSKGGDAPSKRWVLTAPHEAIYAAMWTAYREGAQTDAALQRRTGVSLRMAQTAIHRGWPENNWPALAERWKLFSKQAEQARQAELQADRLAAESAGKTSATRWREHQDKWMPVAEMAPELLASMGQKLKQAMQVATFVRYRKNKTGVVEAYVNAADVARATSLWVQAFKDAPQAMRYLLGPGALAPEPEAPELTAEQLEQLNAGELPAGVTEAMLGAILMRGTKIEGGT